MPGYCGGLSTPQRIMASSSGPRARSRKRDNSLFWQNVHCPLIAVGPVRSLRRERLPVQQSALANSMLLFACAQREVG
jgi:hypothetical protein